MNKEGKVICIDNTGKALTIGKIYTILEVHKLQGRTNVYATGISLLNDNGVRGTYELHLFKTIEDDRDEKLNNLLK